MSTIEQIIADDSLHSVFQPIIDLDSGAVVAYEALARGPLGPLSGPNEMFAAARRAGLLAVLDRACRAAAFRGALAHGLLAPLTLFVNVEPGVLDTAPVDDLLALADSAPGQLQIVLEITERALATRPAELLRTVERVRGLGWGVALDDVGADAASLAFMPLLRPDVVKLDLRLVQERPSPVIAEIMNAVNAYAERTGALVLAEGIETQQHLTVARALGARLGQGWFFARPAAAPALQYPVAPLHLPVAPTAATVAPSPFNSLPVGTSLRRAPKRLLVELSKQLERQAMRLGETCVLAATFQEARHLTPATALRYRDLVARIGFVCVLGEDLPIEPIPGVRGAALAPDDPVRGEWDVVVVSPHFSAALLARDLGDDGPDMDRMFEYALTYRHDIVVGAAHSLLSRVVPTLDPALDPASHNADEGASRSVGDLEVPAASNLQPERGPRAPATSLTPPLPFSSQLPTGWQVSPVSEALLRRALAASTSGITIADLRQPDQPLIYVNRAFEQLVGHRSEELLGRNCRFAQGPDTDHDTVSRLRAAIAEGREVRERLLNYRGLDRTPWWNEIYMAPVADEHGAIVQYIGVQNDVTAHVQAERALVQERDRARSYLARLEDLAYTDFLTGLANRRRFEESVDSSLREAEGNGSVLALLFVDLNGFKSVNDSLGHAAGDDLLVQVAQRIKTGIRRSDLAARLGGDEFLIALSGLDPNDARPHADRIAQQLRDAISAPCQLGEALVSVSISASIGVAIFPDTDADPGDSHTGGDFRSLLHRADMQMYAAKHGR
ncbi:EAL domain-containing protein [Kineococcus rubinsiae]|uniref:EAL domain-containing protein n=1 Tax=Kineococcus rubinsiae TaxID=2609562 RepID=UPI00143226C9|nr:EAL domain-containing protein [Kineococcus rubinsiae]NIZ90368.1 EAL domain-containing protein [Kineococcus rubinsiae]